MTDDFSLIRRIDPTPAAVAPDHPGGSHVTENPTRTASSCRFCGSGLHHTFVDLGMSPLSQALPRRPS